MVKSGVQLEVFVSERKRNLGDEKGQVRKMYDDAYGDKYQIDIVTRDAFSIVGVSIKTTMNDAFHDCPRLWSENFGPRMEELPTFAGPSFGVSVMRDEENFEYWAGVIHVVGQIIPPGMKVLDLFGGLYANCDVEDGLPGLSGAYKYIYHIWEPGSDYDFKLESACYELYNSKHMQTGFMSLYIPVKLKT